MVPLLRLLKEEHPDCPPIKITDVFLTKLKERSDSPLIEINEATAIHIRKLIMKQ